MFCPCIKPSSAEFRNTFNEYKNAFCSQNIFTINEYVENIRLLHNDVKKAGLIELLNEIEAFQEKVSERVKDLMRFHGNVR